MTVINELYDKLKISLKFTIRYTPILRAIFTLILVDRKFPSVIGIDPTNICNLKCKFCPTWKMKWEKGYIELRLIKKIINEVKASGKKLWMVILHNFGEPTLHKELGEIVKIIKESKITRSIQFATNGVALNEKIARELIEAKLDGLTFSVDALTRDEYKEIKGVDALERVKQNAKLIKKIKQELKSKLPHVSAKLVKMTKNRKEWKTFLKEWKSLVDEVALTEYTNWGGNVEYEGVYKIPKKRYACQFLWYYPVIAWNGDVYICCATISQKAIIGNLYKNTLKEIWEGEKMKEIRKAHLQKRFNDIEPCKNCTYWAESKVNLDWFLKP